MSLFRKNDEKKRSQKLLTSDQTGRRERNAESLVDMAELLGQQNDFQEILRIVTSKALSLFNADIASIAMLNPRTQDTIKTIIREGEEADQKRLHLLQKYITGWAVFHKEPFLSGDIAGDSRFAGKISEGITVRSAMCVPLQSERVISGHIVLFNKNPSRSFEAEDLSFLQKFASVSAPFLSNAQKIQHYFEAPVSDAALLAKHEALGLLGRSPQFKEMLRAIEAAAKCDVRVFLEGQSGTGKELVARATHKLSSRCQYPFVAIDCGAIPEELVESELFGHVKGAFTGAASNRKGLIEEANHGTLFMDEVSNLPHDMQAKLLRVLQEGEVRAVGSNQTRKVDVRIIAASSGPIWKSVENQTFRGDLYYRLHVYPIAVPTLNERAGDIPILANHFLQKFAAQQGKKVESFHGSLLQFMQHRCWAGNVRELENFVERLVTLAPTGTAVLDHSILPHEFRKEFKTVSLAQPVRTPPKPLQESLDQYEEQIIRETLIQYEWNQSEAARALGISEGTIRYKMERLGIVKP